MYGTIARMRVKPGSQEALAEQLRIYEAARVPGSVASYIYKMDTDPNEYYISVIFESKETYFANANSPEQDARYRDLRALLEQDPEWHDGEIVYSGVYEAVPVTQSASVDTSSGPRAT